MAVDPAIRYHQAWLGYLQPEGLVVSPAALVDSQVMLPRAPIQLQERFIPFVSEVEHDGRGTLAALTDVPAFLTGFLEWPRDLLVGATNDSAIPDSLRVPLPEFGETLEPGFAFQRPNGNVSDPDWLLIGKVLPIGTDLDARNTADERAWSASESQRFERLMRDTGITIGLLFNGTHIRLIYKPVGESAGTLTFPIGAMREVSGRPILAAFHLLLDRYRLLAAPNEARLPALLKRSREYQSRVSTTLARQVLESLYELLRGFEAANEHARGELLRDALHDKPDDVYSGLLTVLLRLVFLLFAEDRGLLPSSSVYLRNYSVHGLFERLRVDNERYPDTMDHRYGAWAQLLALFQAVHDGCGHPQMKMPARSGYLFDPARFPFLNGASLSERRLPLVSDGTIYRVLEKLLILEGERLSYRTLDVEEIGSVYQTVMGFKLKIARGQMIALSGKRKHKSEVAAPVAIDLDELLAVEAKDRGKWLKERAAHEITGNAVTLLKQAAKIDDLLIALDRRIARNATPHVIHAGGLILQPTDERRRSGSHYTPRALTEPIVRKTLAPVLQRLGENPTPKQILDLKVCDIAMGSGAFLVEACRQLGDALVKAWGVHGERPPIPADEDEVLLARRIIAQRCLYGVDRNAMATDLAKLSLWLATLARDHPFTFLDHAFRTGDSLVGLSRKQITRFHWDDKARADQFVFGQNELEKIIGRVSAYRREILDAGDFAPPELKRQKLTAADDELQKVRRAGDLCIRAFFERKNAKARNAEREEALARFGEVMSEAQRFNFTPLMQLDAEIALFRGDKPTSEKPITPFHWDIEFPEVFDRENGGFDAIVGNPPYAGVVQAGIAFGDRYTDFLRDRFAPAGGKTDLIAFFFRRAFQLLRENAAAGLIATNTVAQGDTRESGLAQICDAGGEIYDVDKRIRWPGSASVIVTRILFSRGWSPRPKLLNDRPVDRITAFLFHSGGNHNPSKLVCVSAISSKGVVPYGMGFVFDDGSAENASIAEMRDLLKREPHSEECIKRFLGGEDLNSLPDLTPERFIIDFDDLDEVAARKWRGAMAIVERMVKPARMRLTTQSGAEGLKRFWWRFAYQAKQLTEAKRHLSRVLVTSQTSKYRAFAFIPSSWVVDQKVVGFAQENWEFFCVMQGRMHDAWSTFFGSTMKDDPVYTPSDCFDTFPFPAGWQTDAALEAAGREYYEVRAALMVRHNEGLTTTYNRFHNPDESDPDIVRLRELHAQMDRAVLAAYGWSDIPTACEFIPDYFDEPAEGGDPIPKSIRYRWPDAVRDEVLARLLKLNAERAEEEKLAGAAATSSSKATTRKRSSKKRSAPPTDTTHAALFS